MRLTCPLCGPRDRREFTYFGDAVWLDRPAAEAAPEAWDAYLHLRDNPAGVTRDLWYHEMGCAQWLVVTRDTVTHGVQGVAPVMPPEAPVAPAGASGGDISEQKKPRKKAAKKEAPDAT